MLKKKNIAMAMAAATVVTAAPAYAAPMQKEVINNTQEQEIKELKADVLEKFNTKYTENQALADKGVKGKNAYTIKMSINGATANEMNSYAEFEKAFDKAFKELKNGEKITVEYASEAIRILEDGTVVNFKEQKANLVDYDTINKDSKDKSIDGAVDSINKFETIKNTGKKASKGELEDGTEYIKVPTTNGYIELKDGDTKLNFNNPKFKVEDGDYVNANGGSIKVFDEKTVITDSNIVLNKGGVIEGYYESVSKTKADPDSDVIAIVKKATAAQKEDVTVADLYEESTARLTKKGNELRKVLASTATKDSKDVTKDTTLVKEVFGINKVGEVCKLDATDLAEIKVIFSERKNEISEWVPAYEMTITEVRKHDFINVRNYIIGTKDTVVDVTAGLDRYQTSVELSKQGWKNETAENVVLVSGANDKLVDGLTATPFAAQKNAPVLLTKKDSVPAEVLDEIERLKAKNVYIVGGESAVSNEVADLLTKKHSLNVKRLAGDSRYETSMAVAEEIKANLPKGETFEEIFVVGGKGEADALSASAIAGSMKTPILLTPASDLDKHVEGFIKANVKDGDNKNDMVDIFVVGGETSVSKKVQSQLVNIPGKEFEVKRLAGEGRQETNAAVISEFAESIKDETGKKSGVVVGKSNNAALVDSLSAGAYAAKTGSHIVLATNELTDSQEDALDKITKVGKKTQAGYGIAEKVAKFIKGL
ncbi:cell wall-binding repeat-containing protein [Romboutsia hominis]|uniref:cell wall-binding repeat-containing protein n=1 Tax=Romboutsia hominis TaxID=1507512 RepID=UPI000AB0EE11|nr:cell wall-binding repeat-containing protein [Romboutsia hominis]